MTPELRAVANSQLGVVSRAQARDAQMTERQLKTAVGPHGAWVVVRRGAYAERWEWDGADEAQRYLMRVSAANLMARQHYVLSHSSAAVGIAREYGLEDGVIVGDEVLRLGGSRTQMTGVLGQMRSWPYVTTAREAVALADPGAENMAESLGRLLVCELGFGVPATQVLIEDGRRRPGWTCCCTGTSSRSTGD